MVDMDMVDMDMMDNGHGHGRHGHGGIILEGPKETSVVGLFLLCVPMKEEKQFITSASYCLTYRSTFWDQIWGHFLEKIRIPFIILIKIISTHNSSLNLKKEH